MTMRTSYRVECPCGHMGVIRVSENDAPFSQSYENYAVVDLDGSEFSVEGSASWETAFTAMKPTCPDCGTRLSPSDLRDR